MPASSDLFALRGRAQMEVLRGLRCVRWGAGVAGGCPSEENKEAQGGSCGSWREWRGCFSGKTNQTRDGTLYNGGFERKQRVRRGRLHTARISMRVAARDGKGAGHCLVQRYARHVSRRTLQGEAPIARRAQKSFGLWGAQDGVVWPQVTRCVRTISEWRTSSEAAGGGEAEASGRDDEIAGGGAHF